MQESNENNLIESEIDNQQVSEQGASLVEYALLVALIAVVCIAGVTFLGTSASAKFSGIGSTITSAG